MTATTTAENAIEAIWGSLLTNRFSVSATAPWSLRSLASRIGVSRNAFIWSNRDVSSFAKTSSLLSSSSLVVSNLRIPIRCPVVLAESWWRTKDAGCPGQNASAADLSTASGAAMMAAVRRMIFIIVDFVAKYALAWASARRTSARKIRVEHAYAEGLFGGAKQACREYALYCCTTRVMYVHVPVPYATHSWKEEAHRNIGTLPGIYTCNSSS